MWYILKLLALVISEILNKSFRDGGAEADIDDSTKRNANAFSLLKKTIFQTVSRKSGGKDETSGNILIRGSVH